MKDETIILKGKFKAKIWPCLYFLLTAAFLALAYFFHQNLSSDLILPIGAIVLGLLMFIFGVSLLRFYSKRKLVVTGKDVVIMDAKNCFSMPIAEIDLVELEKKTLLFFYDEQIISVKGLRNRKAIYAKLLISE